ncbi:MAG: hypothetical protein M3Q96_01965, partial [Pseudomonadota bacterium]|nr:hypothetical protein [Pseudomonadota bacterium]
MPLSLRNLPLRNLQLRSRLPLRAKSICSNLIVFALMAMSAAPLQARAIDEKDLLPVDDAFALSATATERDRIAIDWKIADGYYLYRHRISVQPTTTAFKANALQLPGGEKHTDEFFGKVETYRTQLRATLPGVASAGADTVTLKIKYQGCADLGICYPPQTRTLTVALPASDAASAGGDATGFVGSAPNRNVLGNTPGNGSVTSPLFGTAPGGRSDRLPLPPERAFAFEAIADGGNQLLLRFTPARGYYLYRDRTTLSLEAGNGIALERPRWPKGQAHRDEHFGDVVVYFDQVEVPVPLRRTSTDARRGTLTATFQGCQNDGICYPPMTRKVLVSLPAGTVSAKESAFVPQGDLLRGVGAASAVGAGAASGTRDIVDAGTVSPGATVAPAGEEQELATQVAPTKSFDVKASALAEDSRIAASLAGSGRWMALLGFFGFGLLLAFTPCVLPMIPILSG